MTMLAVAPVLTTFRADRGDAVPERPNRHAVAHTLDRRQYSEPNALQAVLLAVSGGDPEPTANGHSPQACTVVARHSGGAST